MTNVELQLRISDLRAAALSGWPESTDVSQLRAMWDCTLTLVRCNAHQGALAFLTAAAATAQEMGEMDGVYEVRAIRLLENVMRGLA